MMRRILRNSSGQGLVQALVALAISGIATMAIVSMQSSQSRENRALSEKLASLDLQKMLMTVLSDGSVCTGLATVSPRPTFNANDANAVIAIPAIPASATPGAPIVAGVGQVAGALSSSLVVQSMQLANIKPSGAANQYTAELQVGFDTSKLIRAIHPLSIRMTLQTDPASPADAKTIQGCNGSASTLQFGGLYQYYVQCGNEDGHCRNATTSWTCGAGGGPFNASCDNACRHPNPVTGKCACPAGFTELSYLDYLVECGSPAYGDAAVPVAPSGYCGIGGIICGK